MYYKRSPNCHEHPSVTTSTILYSVFIFGQMKERNIEHLSCGVKFVETIFNEYAYERGEVGHSASD